MKDWASQLWSLADKLKEADRFPRVVLRQSIDDVAYILRRIEELTTIIKAESFTNHGEVWKKLKVMDLIRFYSQCLLLWSYRILEILKETSNSNIPHDIRIARNVLAGHLGVASKHGGKLQKEKLNMRQGFIGFPKISPDGNLTYVIGPLGGPESIASPEELLIIKKLYKKYCPEEPDPNMWEICRQILYKGNNEIGKQDLKNVEYFLLNNGGTISDSDRIISHVVNSLKEYCDE